MNRAEARFCGKCGTSLVSEITCPSCAAVNPPDNRFCETCGQALTASAPPAVTEPGLPDLRELTPQHLAEQILEARRSLAGERKQVTVLFADVKGSMDLAEQTDPERWRSIMHSFFRLLCEGVHRFEGTVDKFTGDGIMALFGAPIAHEDHAIRACYAALDLHQRLAGYAVELRRSESLNFSVRIGINSGEVVVGEIGEDLSLEYTAIGHTVGLAQRMESLAEAGRSYLTASTARLVEGYFELRPLGEFGVKGASGPVPVFELAGVGRARTRLDVARARGLSRFVGRDKEMGTLEAALERALEGNGQVVGMVGEAGVGKSRLCEEFVARASARNIPVYSAAATPHGQHVPFLAALEMLRGYFGVEPDDEPRTARERIAGRLLLFDQGFADDLPLIFDFLGVPDEEQPMERMNPEARQRRLLDVVRRLVHAQSRREVAINLLEDAHWIDPGSALLLETLVDSVPGTRNLTLINFRPEYHAAWMAKSYYQQVPLVPLGPSAAKELLADLLGSDDSLGGLPEEIRQRTGGNPFFIEEVIRGLVEDGGLEGTAGAFRLVRPGESVRVPATVQSVLAARIDRLSARDKALLQSAAVLGREFGESVLERIAELSEPDLAAALRALTSGEFIYQQALYPEAEYAFRHALTQEVAYTSQLSERRSQVHAAVAGAIEDLYPESLDERAALIAHHWEAAGETRLAMRWHARSAAWAGLNGPAEAVRHWRRVRELAATLDEDAEVLGLGVAARVWILQFGWRLGLAADLAEQIFEEGCDLARRGGDQRSLILLQMTYGGIQGVAGDVETALEITAEAMRLAEGLGDEQLLATVPQFLIYLLYNAGRWDEGLVLADEWLRSLELNPNAGAGIVVASPRASALFQKAMLHANRGELDRSLALLDEAVATARAAGDPETESWAHMIFAFIGYITWSPDRALAAGLKTVELAERIGDVFSRSWALTWCATAQIVVGDHRAAIELLEQALHMSADSRAGLEGRPSRLGFLAEALLAAGELEQASAVAEEAVSIARAEGLDGPLVGALWQCGRVRYASGDMESAQAALTEAIDRCRVLGAASWEALAYDTLSQVSAARGELARAETELRRALELFDQLGAQGRRDPARERLEELLAAQRV